MQNYFLVAHWRHKNFNMLKLPGFKTKTKWFFNKSIYIIACHQLFPPLLFLSSWLPQSISEWFPFEVDRKQWMSVLVPAVLGRHWALFTLVTKHDAFLHSGGTGFLTSAVPTPAPIPNPVTCQMGPQLREGFWSNWRVNFLCSSLIGFLASLKM